MSKKTLSIILMVAGILLFAISLGADVLGIGGDLSVIGWKQLTGAGVGLLLFIIGFLQRRKIKPE